MHKGLIYILDDDAAVRDSLVALFESSQFQAVAFSTTDEFLARCSQLQPDCAIIDIRMPGVSGLELLSIMRQRQMNIPVLVITGHGDVYTAVQSMKLGAVDVLQKPFSYDALMRAIHSSLQQGNNSPSPVSLPERDLSQEDIKQRLKSLSPREREILELIMRGQSSREIAERLSISVATVNNHRSQIKSKMNARTVAHLLSMLNSMGHVA